MALVYMNRLTTITKLPLTYQNWRSVWLVVIMLAQKVWDDKPVRTSGFARLLPGVNAKLLRRLEFKTLSMMRFVTGVRPSLYARYYFELRHLYEDIIGSSSGPIWAFSEYTKSKLNAKNELCEELRTRQCLKHSVADIQGDAGARYGSSHPAGDSS